MESAYFVRDGENRLGLYFYNVKVVEAYTEFR